MFSKNNKFKKRYVILLLATIFSLILWVVSFSYPLAVAIPGILGGNVHNSDFTMLLVGGRIHTHLIGCYPYYWEATNGMYLFAFNPVDQKAKVGVYRRHKNIFSIDARWGRFFGCSLGVNSPEFLYSVISVTNECVRFRYEEYLGRAEIEIDMKNGKIIDQSLVENKKD